MIPSRLSAESSLFRYCLSSGLSGATTLGVAFGLHQIMNAPELFAGWIAFLCAFALNFFLLRHFVYSADGCWRRQLIRYGAVSGFFRAAEAAFYTGLLVTSELNYLLLIALILIASTIIKFVAYRVLVFN
jgi:putative flippase GtrA